MIKQKQAEAGLRAPESVEENEKEIKQRRSVCMCMCVCHLAAIQTRHKLLHHSLTLMIN